MRYYCTREQPHPLEFLKDFSASLGSGSVEIPGVRVHREPESIVAALVPPCGLANAKTGPCEANGQGVPLLDGLWVWKTYVCCSQGVCRL